jgi:hypothetical protein
MLYLTISTVFKFKERERERERDAVDEDVRAQGVVFPLP